MEVRVWGCGSPSPGHGLPNSSLPPAVMPPGGLGAAGIQRSLPRYRCAHSSRTAASPGPFVRRHYAKSSRFGSLRLWWGGEFGRVGAKWRRSPCSKRGAQPMRTQLGSVRFKQDWKLELREAQGNPWTGLAPKSLRAAGARRCHLGSSRRAPRKGTWLAPKLVWKKSSDPAPLGGTLLPRAMQPCKARRSTPLSFWVGLVPTGAPRTRWPYRATIGLRTGVWLPSRHL